MSLCKPTLLGTALCMLAGSAVAQVTPQDKPHSYPKADTAATQATTPAPVVGMARASRLLGKSVVDVAGKPVGKVSELISCTSGDLVVLITRNGDAKLVGVPMDALTVRLSGKQADPNRAHPTGDKAFDAVAPDNVTVEMFALSVGTDLAGAPVAADRTGIDTAWWNAYCAHYDVMDVGRHDPAGETADHDGETADPDGMTAQTKPMTSMGSHAVLLSSLIGQEVKSAKGDELGDIKDVAVNLAESKAAYALVAAGGLLGVNSTLHGVRLSDLEPDATQEHLLLKTDKETLARTPALDLDRLPTRPVLVLVAFLPSDASHRDSGKTSSR